MIVGGWQLAQDCCQPSYPISQSALDVIGVLAADLWNCYWNKRCSLVASQLRRRSVNCSVAVLPKGAYHFSLEGGAGWKPLTVHSALSCFGGLLVLLQRSPLRLRDAVC